MRNVTRLAQETFPKSAAEHGDYLCTIQVRNPFLVEQIILRPLNAMLQLRIFNKGYELQN